LNASLFFALSILPMFIYQPFATAGWALILLDFILHEDTLRGIRRLLVASLLYASMLVVYFLIFRYFMIELLPPDGSRRHASPLPLHALVDKIIWFIKGPLFTVFTPFHTHGAAWLATFMVLLSLFGLWEYKGKCLLHFVASCAVAMGALVISHLPSLAAVENTGTRTEVSITLTAFVLICVGLRTVANKAIPLKRITSVLAALTALAISEWASYTILTVAVWPQSAEVLLVERALDRTKLPTDRPIVLVSVPNGTSLVGRYCDGVAQIGCLSTSAQFALPNMVRLWMRQRGIDPRLYKLLFVQSADSKVAVSFEPDRTTYGPIPEDAFYLDLGRIVAPVTGSVPHD